MTTCSYRFSAERSSRFACERTNNAAASSSARRASGWRGGDDDFDAVYGGALAHVGPLAWVEGVDVGAAGFAFGPAALGGVGDPAWQCVGDRHRERQAADVVADQGVVTF